jgi:hypothetical protein
MNSLVQAAVNEAIRGALAGGGQALKGALEAAARDGIGMIIIIQGKPRSDPNSLVHFRAGITAADAFDVLKRVAKKIRSEG